MRTRVSYIVLSLATFLALGPEGCGEGSGDDVSSAAGGLPSGWQDADVGAAGQSGSAAFSDGTFTLRGSGADIWGASDAFHFAYRSLSGDGEIVARVVSLDRTDGWAKGGVMIRETLQPDSRFAMTVTTPDFGATFQYRTQTGAAAGMSGAVSAGFPGWVKISRVGNSFTGSCSADGQAWTVIGSVTIGMAGEVYAGLCVTAHNNTATAAGVMDSVSVAVPSGGPPPPPPPGSISVATPVHRTVYQRNNSNQAVIPVSGTCPASSTRVEGRLLAVNPGQGASTDWAVADSAPAGGSFSGSLSAPGGWYRLEVRALQGDSAVASAAVDRVGVGEVFIVCGHSVAHGSEQNIAGASDERVNTIPIDNQSQLFADYNSTGLAQYLHPAGFGFFGTGVKPAPYGYGNYFWSKFGEHLAQRLNVPVLIYNAAFGGTSLEHWSKSSQGIWFEHSFVNASIRMPYINLCNTLASYIPLTGLRAVLSDQGQNDYPQKDEDLVLGYYRTWVNQARADLGFASMAVVVNRATPFMTEAHIRRVQERMIQTPNCFAGPDYDTLAPEDRYDGTHLSLSGQAKAAQMWADALNDGFFASSAPHLPAFPAPAR